MIPQDLVDLAAQIKMWKMWDEDVNRTFSYNMLDSISGVTICYQQTHCHGN